MEASLKAEIRNERVTKSDLKKLRDSGKVPGVVYGKKVSSTSIAVDEKELQQLLRRSPRSILEMDIPEQGKYPVMVSGLQRDKISRSLLHIDFHQINMNEPVRTAVPLELTGESPAQREGGLLTAVLHEVEVRCLPNDLPAAITADISGLQLGDSLLARDLVLPSGVELKTDENAVVATILVPQKATEETEIAVNAAEAEEKKEQGAAEEVAQANA